MTENENEKRQAPTDPNGRPKMNILDDLTPGDLQVLRRETGLTLIEAEGDLIAFLQFLYLVGQKKRVDTRYTWPMTLSLSIRELKNFVEAYWDVEVSGLTDPDAEAPDDLEDLQGNS